MSDPKNIVRGKEKELGELIRGMDTSSPFYAKPSGKPLPLQKERSKTVVPTGKPLPLQKEREKGLPLPKKY